MIFLPKLPKSGMYKHLQGLSAVRSVSCVCVCVCVCTLFGYTLLGQLHVFNKKYTRPLHAGARYKRSFSDKWNFPKTYKKLSRFSLIFPAAVAVENKTWRRALGRRSSRSHRRHLGWNTAVPLLRHCCRTGVAQLVQWSVDRLLPDGGMMVPFPRGAELCLP